MGSGAWDSNVYDQKQAQRPAGQSAFQYSQTTRNSVPPQQWKAHDTLNPLGVKVRESRDSTEHPEATPVAIFFDVTGSMGVIPQTLQTKLAALYTLILLRGYMAHPQILYGAIGDAYTDRVPLQVGQFESDNRADENLANILLESGGGGQMHESYELAVYMMARHTAHDAWEKRGNRGFLFIIGDELPYDYVEPDQVKEYIGDNLRERIPLREILREAQQRYEVFFLMAGADNYNRHAQIFAAWQELLGERAIRLDDADAVCETIALTLGMTNGAIDLAQGLQDLTSMNVPAGTVSAVGKALQVMPTGAAVAKSSGALPGLVPTDQSSNKPAIRRL